MTGSAGQRALAQLYWRWLHWRDDPSARAVEHYVRAGDVVVDVGGSWGAYTDRFARLVGPRGQVYVVEPHPLNAGSLSAIGAGRPNVTVFRVALSDRATDAHLRTPRAHGRQVTALSSVGTPGEASPAGYATTPVRVERLDDLLRGENRRVVFLKCDVEGHELAVLRGAEATLRRSRPVLLVEIERRHAGADMEATFGYLAALGYIGYALDATGPRPLDDFDVERDQLAHLDAGVGLYGVPSRYIKDFLFVPATLGEGGRSGGEG